MRFLLLLLILLTTGCVGAADTFAVLDTDAGTWRVEVDTLWSTGWQELDVLVLDSGSESPVCDLAVVADVTMPSMGHGSDESVTVELLGDGTYRVRAHFQMEGPWELTATLDSGAVTDRFAVDLDVVGG